ncbi:MAG: helix-turn-helix transcriptional regulator [Clostridia bacterium]|nr:helix-turn-helix transcriptional regulator [Clostridia bacterium]
MMNPIEFSTNLFALRRENNLSVEELANLLNVTPEIICEWECAKTSPTMEQMDRLAKIYRIPLDQIVRNPKPRKEVPLPEEAPPVQEPISVDLPEEDPQPEAEIVEEAEEEVLPLPRRGKKSRSKWVDVVVIALLLGIIAAATVFLINPQWFPWLK